MARGASNAAVFANVPSSIYIYIYTCRIQTFICIFCGGGRGEPSSNGVGLEYPTTPLPVHDIHKQYAFVSQKALASGVLIEFPLNCLWHSRLTVVNSQVVGPTIYSHGSIVIRFILQLGDRLNPSCSLRAIVSPAPICFSVSFCFSLCYVSFCSRL